MEEAMICDNYYTRIEFCLWNKPVVTKGAIEKDMNGKNKTNADELHDAFIEVQTSEKYEKLRQWVVDNYDPYLDGKLVHRMLEGVRDYIKRHGVPKKRSLNIWRKYTSIKTFGNIKRR